MSVLSYSIAYLSYFKDFEIEKKTIILFLHSCIINLKPKALKIKENIFIPKMRDLFVMLLI